MLENKKDNYGNITDVVIKGGGFGHGVGMSQYGAGYMSIKLKQPYYNILRHYYTGINLGTMPVTVLGGLRLEEHKLLLQILPLLRLR